MQTVTLYTDGSAKSTGGAGAAAAILIYRGNERELTAGYRFTNHNRMELTAAIIGLEALKRACAVTVYGDAEYLINTMRAGFALKWKAAGWVKSGKPVVNADLWARLLRAAERHDVTWVWVRGHDGDEYNERADKLAGRLAKQITSGEARGLVDKEYEKRNPYRELDLI